MMMLNQLSSFTHYQAPYIDLFVGDIFNLSIDLVGQIDVIYDRAALVALPIEMRMKYTRHLIDITCSAPQLILCFEYDQTLMPGPPFSITSKEIHSHYTLNYSLNALERRAMPEKLKGEFDAYESVWHLTPKDPDTKS